MEAGKRGLAGIGSGGLICPPDVVRGRSAGRRGMTAIYMVPHGSGNHYPVSGKSAVQ
jgi:hypothetical protein